MHEHIKTLMEDIIDQLSSPEQLGDTYVLQLRATLVELKKLKRFT